MFVFNSFAGFALPMFVELIVVVTVGLFLSPILPLDVMLLIILMFRGLVLHTDFIAFVLPMFVFVVLAIVASIVPADIFMSPICPSIVVLLIILVAGSVVVIYILTFIINFFINIIC